MVLSVTIMLSLRTKGITHMRTHCLRIGLGLLALSAALPLGACQAFGTSEVMSAERQKALTPDEVLTELKAGNERFVSGRMINRNYQAQAENTANGQFPKAIVLGCLDSRVPPELVFDQGIGDIFVGRVAGNFETPDMLGSFEFGTKVAGAKVIVVLGHTSCGAVKGAIDRAELGNLTATLENIHPAIDAVPHTQLERTSANTNFVNRVIEANVKQTVRDILDDSDVISDLVDSGDLLVVGGVYDLATGQINWLDT
jgi:carbonic anhydrase